MTNTSNANITKASKNAVFHENLDNNHQSDEQFCFACNQSQSQVAQARSKKVAAPVSDSNAVENAIAVASAVANTLANSTPTAVAIS